LSTKAISVTVSPSTRTPDCSTWRRASVFDGTAPVATRTSIIFAPAGALTSAISSGSSPAPNGLSWELKSVSFRNKKEILVPKETMAITMINPEELKKQEFFQSHCWSKLKSIIFCAVMWHGHDAENAELVKVVSLDFLETDELIKEIEIDYNLIRNKRLRF
jgi:hypothetical protein